MFKMDKNGAGIEVDLDNLAEVEELNFKNFTSDMFLACCILSGCDYLESIKGIGFKKAHRLVFEQGGEISNILKKVRREGKFIIPQEYEKTFEKALLTFKFQLIYCPIKKDLAHMNDPDTHEMGPLLKNYSNLDFLGKRMPTDIAQQIARGEIDPMSHKPYSLIEQENMNKQTFYRNRNKPVQFINNPIKEKKPESQKGTIHNFFGKAGKTETGLPLDDIVTINGLHYRSKSVQKMDLKAAKVSLMLKNSRRCKNRSNNHYCQTCKFSGHQPCQLQDETERTQ